MPDMFAEDIITRAREVFSLLDQIPLADKVETINQLRLMLHERSPFATEPVDCVLWIPSDSVHSNDYNPNVVAPPEMRLLQVSIGKDGYTQPIVGFKQEDTVEVVDGFHRHRVGKEVQAIRNRVHGYLPVTLINHEREDKGDRIASTIRHNRARGKHTVEGMSDIVIDLKRRNWSDERIGRDLGMDPDEVLRLSQISGLAEMFADREFSEAWEASDETDIPSL